MQYWCSRIMPSDQCVIVNKCIFISQHWCSEVCMTLILFCVCFIRKHTWTNVLDPQTHCGAVPQIAVGRVLDALLWLWNRSAWRRFGRSEATFVLHFLQTEKWQDEKYLQWEKRLRGWTQKNSKCKQHFYHLQLKPWCNKSQELHLAPVLMTPCFCTKINYSQCSQSSPVNDDISISNSEYAPWWTLS